MSDDGNKSSPPQKPREWTAEEMQEAEPLPMPELDEAGKPSKPAKDDGPEPC